MSYDGLKKLDGGLLLLGYFCFYLSKGIVFSIQCVHIIVDSCVKVIQSSREDIQQRNGGTLRDDKRETVEKPQPGCVPVTEAVTVGG